MKRIILFATSLSFILFCSMPQSKAANIKTIPTEQTPQKKADKKTSKKKHVWKPSFPGGIKALSEYIQTNLQWPSPEVAGDTEGVVVLRLYIDKTGRVTMADIVRNLKPAFDEAAFHLILNMPYWVPGKEDGKPIDSFIDVPILFKK
jgi:TonB family protein